MTESLERARHLPWNAPLASYEAQAELLLRAHRAGDVGAMKLLHHHLPRFLDPAITWLPRELADGEIEGAELTMDDSRLAVARVYGFRDWSALAQLVNAVSDNRSAVHEFERAVESVITGDADALQHALDANPTLIHARSVRVTCHDPPVHGATLLHYIGANGVEGYRQRTPSNAVTMARLLLEAGAEADALAGMYGSRCPTLAMLVSSSPPADAGVQVPLVHLLIDHGANPDGAGEGSWRSTIVTALVFGFRDAASALVERGALIDTLPKAAGLGLLDNGRDLLPGATAAERHSALALAAICGQTAVVRLLIAAGEDPNRLNPEGHHSHSTPLHQAAGAGHVETVKALVELGARVDINDTLWQSNALGWAQHGGQSAVVEYLEGVTN